MAVEQEGFAGIVRFVTEQLRTSAGGDEAQLNVTAAEVVAEVSAEVAAETAAETASEVAAEMAGSAQTGA